MFLFAVMNSIRLFTDGSVHPPSRLGYGAQLVVIDPIADIEQLKARVQLKRFEDTSSTQLEIETLIWALQGIQSGKVTIYTDSQNIIGLPDRRGRLERNAYRSRAGIPLKHAERYQEFSELSDALDCTFVKVEGHRKTNNKTEIDDLFTLVDRASRQALRTELASR